MIDGVVTTYDELRIDEDVSEDGFVDLTCDDCMVNCDDELI